MATNLVPPDGYTIARRWTRFDINVPLRVIAPKSDKIVIVQGRGNELNEGGMSVFAGMEMKIGETVAVEFTPPYSGEPIRARCVVRNRTGYTYGVEFLLETNEDHASASQIRAVLHGVAAAR